MYYKNEPLRHKLYDGDAKHTIFICICKFSLPRKAKILRGCMIFTRTQGVNIENLRTSKKLLRNYEH